MFVKMVFGEFGFLVEGKLGNVVLFEFLDLIFYIDKYVFNFFLMNVLY